MHTNWVSDLPPSPQAVGDDHKGEPEGDEEPQCVEDAVEHQQHRRAAARLTCAAGGSSEMQGSSCDGVQFFPSGQMSASSGVQQEYGQARAASEHRLSPPAGVA